MKKLLLGLNIVLIGVVLYLVLGGKKEAVAPSENLPSTEGPKIEETKESSEILSGEEEKIIYDNSKYLKIDIKYPAFENKTTSKVIKDFVDNQLEIFKKESSYETLSQDEKDRMDENGSQYEFLITYKTYRTENTASVVFSIYNYNGGAHGGLIIRSLNFKSNDNLFTIGDIFQPESNYLETLSKISRTKLKEKLAENLGSWGDDGTAPITSNFETFYLTPGKLNIVFQPYQVAPWASGTPEISIDIKNELGGITNKNFY
jgi:hypothetical protein